MVWKSEAHKDPSKIHREVAVAIFSNEDEVLLQRRSLSKTNDPGEWKITAAGHVGAKEEPEKAARREVKEELGINITPTFFGKWFSVHEDKEARFFWIYYSILDRKPKLILDKDEVMDAKWIKIANLKDFAKKFPYFVNSTSFKTIIEIYKTVFTGS